MTNEHTSNEETQDDLMQMRLPELRQLYQQVTGLTNSTPNKVFLSRQILAARARRAEREHAQAIVGSETRPRVVRRAAAHAGTSAADPSASGAADSVSDHPSQTATTSPDEAPQGLEPNVSAPAIAEELEAIANDSKRLSKVPVEKLREVHDHYVGRPTRSRDRAYLLWKIGQARNGKVRRGAAEARQRSEASLKVVPLRIEASDLEQLDAARERLRMKTRMELFRRALAKFLASAGETEVAQLFEDPSGPPTANPSQSEYTPRQGALDLEDDSE